ncbi:uncharacterized protein [Zea mays]|nr:uncharacterized protein LOC103645703 isoform X4 [Zea mays]XP_020402593.1 uncharacterized protein LOC103645703 isoform X4 [Zea mays]XP_020402594.1 uncharacterized protein LOC103645703 isoform X4 [Zea mays]XP_020402595.1 uncharacterized protein LOC103645703 isoform X4 [Zea mays]XP_020402596.1 uncharacterized protein LOC103645703 isoform X4 [Zea mays]XP_020402597.1 uncharacterized protein LOC103645703 isoform X4 [Zea mays]XP_020402598.1 uncharacterized protein LOC103645703 isoform X4 [Zea may|eukprot:XP_020402590.1 disease resistance protein RPM1 isoform X4 [Zea mays]
MAVLPTRQDPLLNIPAAPSPLPAGRLEHEHDGPTPFLFPARRINNLALASTVLPKRVPLHLLQKITNDFSKDRELGSGAYGKVYKGVHKNGETMAVKLLHSMAGLDDKLFEEEFHNIARLQHKNIVRLVGFCHETQRQFIPHDGKMIFADSKYMALCFEYMHNGSLDKFIIDENSVHDWSTRYAIIKGICEGLKYLHEELNPPIYHLDLKPANILLDDNMMPKLADFGLSKIFEQERTRITQSCVGTHGYLPPEYIDRKVISNKLDIFSLGVIIIKIISGPTGYTQCAEMPSKQFVELVHEKWRNKLQTTMDAAALETYCEQVVRCIEMALSCVETDRHKRPSIGAIIDELNKMETNTDQVFSVDICSTPAQTQPPPLPDSSHSTEETSNTKGVSRLGPREYVQSTMRDLVIGITKSVVEGVISKAQSVMEEENMLLISMQHDLHFITDEFQMIYSFLSITDEERINNAVVRIWVMQTRGLAYDLEDYMDAFSCLDKTRKWWSRLFRACLAPPGSPYMSVTSLAVELKHLKARVEDVSHRNTRYNLISDAGSKPGLVRQQPVPPGAVAYENDTRRKHILGDLTQLITNKDDADLQLISMWGAGGGTGTTSIIRKCYSDPEIIQNFICRAWVNLSHPFNPHEFVRSLMAHFYANSCQERQGGIIGVDVLTSMDATATQGDLLSEFVQLVDKNRYLVVLEDLPTMAEWDSIRTFLPDRKNGSWIIVSSQKYEIASLCVGHPYQILDLKQSSPTEHSVCAFLREEVTLKEKKGGNRKEKIYVGDESEVNNGSTSTNSKVISTEYDLSHNHRMVANSKWKEARDWMQNSSLVGRRLQMYQIHRCIAEAQRNHSHVMSVWGIVGVGKSAIVRNFYCDRILENQQFQEYGWVDLSHSQPFNLKDFSQNLLTNFQSDSLQANETTPSRGILGTVRKCCEFLSTRHCLVVIDGLQSKEEWDLIQSSLVSRYSKSNTIIIVITTEASIAAYCADKDDLVFNVKTLETDAAFDLFENEISKKAPLWTTSLCDRGNSVTQELVSKCGGLPMVIVAIAGILATKVVSWMDTATSINLRFMFELEINPDLQDLFSWVHSCFRTCPDFIKPCIFYLSFFPRDHNIRRRRLVRRWIAEGYCRDSDDKSAEENGEFFFSKLLGMSIIQPESSDARMVSCQINGFFRECILSRSGEMEDLVIELADRCNLTTQRSGRHLVISESWDRDKILFESIDFSRLRSMTVFGMWKSFFISKSMKLVRVLDLEDALGLTDENVDQMVKLLPCLKFLSLRGCQKISHLPSSLGDLRLLQTLDVVNTSIVTLPASITKLKKLQYIRGGTTSITSEDPLVPHTSVSWLSKFRRSPLGGLEVPSGIGELTGLHTLGVVDIGASAAEAILRELKKLTQLRKLGVFGVNSNNCGAFVSAISGHFHLESLSVWLDEENGRCSDCIFVPLKNLRSLKLYGVLNRLPLINQLSKLTKLDLEITTLMQEDISFLGKLPTLCILRLCVEDVNAPFRFSVFTNGVEERSYQKLKVLEIACRSSLSVTFGSEAMKNLDLLKLDCCSGQLRRLFGLLHLSELKEVWLKGSYEETLKHDLEVQLAAHPNNPVLKLGKNTLCTLSWMA